MPRTCAYSIECGVTRSGAVDYLDPAAHLASGFTIELGADPPNEIETSPVGWTYRNLRIVAHHL